MDINEDQDLLSLRSLRPTSGSEEEAIRTLQAAYQAASSQCPAPTRIRDLLLAPALATATEREHVFKGDCRLCGTARRSFAEYPHPEPLTLALHKKGRLPEAESDAISQHVTGCQSCKAIDSQDWMVSLERLVAAGTEGITQARRWLSHAARLSFHPVGAHAYSSENASPMKLYSSRHESGDFVVHIEQTEDGALRIIVFSEEGAYAGSTALVILAGQDVTIEREINLFTRGDFAAVGTVILGEFSALAGKLGMAAMFVIPHRIIDQPTG